MKILHINNIGKGSIYNQVILPFMQELENNGFQNFFFSPERLQKGNIYNRVLLKIFNKRIFFDKIIRVLFTKNDYYFYNITERLSIFSAKKILKYSNSPDIIILYWVSGIINSKTIYKLQQITNAKIFWYPMDLAPLSGGCHYTWNCLEYTNQCSHCPAIKLPLLNIAKWNMTFKTKYLTKTKIELFAATQTLYHQLSNSTLFKSSNIVNMPIGINSNIFTCSTKKELLYNNNTQKIIKKRLLIGAYSLKDRRKGISLLVDAINLLFCRNPEIFNTIELCIIGNNKLELFENQKISTCYLGYLNQSELIDEYQKAYTFICPSIEDAGPLMVNQSLMCGTPVVAFKVGVSKDYIVNNITGFIAEKKDSHSLANAIENIISISGNDYTEMVRNCRAISLNKFDIGLMPDKIIKQLEIN